MHMNPTNILLPGLGDPMPGLYVLSRSATNRLESLRIPVGAGVLAPTLQPAEKVIFIEALANIVKRARGTKYRLYRAILKKAVVSVADLSEVDYADGSVRVLHSTPDELLTQMFHHPKLLSRATPHDIDLLVNKCKGTIVNPEQPHPQQAILLHWETDRAAVEKLGRSMFLVLSLAVQLSSICIG
ncbi:hypothetical protein PG987_010070 [Apiospora arundinis]